MKNKKAMQRKRLSMLSVCLITVLCIMFCESVKSQKKVDEKYLDSTMLHYLNTTKMAGVAGAIILKDEVVWMNGYGLADKERQIPFTSETIMNPGSIAKTMTGVCLMKLVEENKLSLDEDINRYLPFKVINPYFPKEKITLRMIATHSSSLADRMPFYSDSTFFTEGNSPEPLGEFLKNYFVHGGKYYNDANFYQTKPGTYWEYSNIAAGLAGYIVELAAGKKLNEYSREIVFKPLGMNNSGWFLPEINRLKHASLYHNKGETTIQIPLYEMITYPDGGLRTSVDELSKFFVMLLNDGRYKNKQVLKPATIQQMQTLQFTEANKPANINLSEKNEGIFWRTKYNVTLLGHGGNDFGVKALMLTDMKKSVGIVLFTNTEDSDPKRNNGFFLLFEALLEYALKLNTTQIARSK
ncbi:MAG: serine hydrolase domain-containing protein [Sediminibacterium sp.]